MCSYFWTNEAVRAKHCHVPRKTSLRKDVTLPVVQAEMTHASGKNKKFLRALGLHLEQPLLPSAEVARRSGLSRSSYWNKLRRVQNNGLLAVLREKPKRGGKSKIPDKLSGELSRRLFGGEYLMKDILSWLETQDIKMSLAGLNKLKKKLKDKGQIYPAAPARGSR